MDERRYLERQKHCGLALPEQGIPLCVPRVCLSSRYRHRFLLGQSIDAAEGGPTLSMLVLPWTLLQYVLTVGVVIGAPHSAPVKEDRVRADLLRYLIYPETRARGVLGFVYVGISPDDHSNTSTGLQYRHEQSTAALCPKMQEAFRSGINFLETSGGKHDGNK